MLAINWLKVSIVTIRSYTKSSSLPVRLHSYNLSRVAIDSGEDWQDIQELVEEFAYSQNPIITGNQRVHFISAKVAIKAILEKTENDYLKRFQNFTQSLEKFLTAERGLVEVKQSVTRLQELIQAGLEGLHQAEEVLDSKIKLSEEEKQKILEQIGEASGRSGRISLLADQLMDEVMDQATESWSEWYKHLRDRMSPKNQCWSSEHHPVFSQGKLIEDYSNQFIQDLSQEIDNWGNQKLRDIILKQNLRSLDEMICQELQAIQAELKSHERPIRTCISQELNLSMNGISDDFMGFGGFVGGVGIGGALAAGLLAFTGVGLIPIILAGVAAGLTGGFGLGILDIDGLRYQIRDKVFEVGFQKFDASIDQFSKKWGEIIRSVFMNRVKSANQFITQAISLYENLLEQQEKAHEKTLEQYEVEKALISHKRKEFDQVQRDVEAVLN